MSANCDTSQSESIYWKHYWEYRAKQFPKADPPTVFVDNKFSKGTNVQGEILFPGTQGSGAHYINTNVSGGMLFQGNMSPQAAELIARLQAQGQNKKAGQANESLLSLRAQQSSNIVAPNSAEVRRIRAEYFDRRG